MMSSEGCGPGRASDGRQLEVAEAMALPRQTVYHWFKRGAEKRPAAMAGEANWAQAPKRLCSHAISKDNAERAAAFITNHASVNWSPLSSDTILIANAEGKRLPTRVAHAEDGLTPIYTDWEEANPGVMMERRFRDCCPKNVKPMTKRKRQFCACRYHMGMRMRHARLKQLRSQIKKGQQQQRSAGGRGRGLRRGRGRGLAVPTIDARPMDAPLEHETLQDAIDAVTCDPPAGFQLVRAACAHGQCSSCPELEKRCCEWDETREMTFTSLGKRQVGEDEDGNPKMREMEVHRHETQTVFMTEYDEGTSGATVLYSVGNPNPNPTLSCASSQLSPSSRATNSTSA
jgi:hypothetical protein